METSTGSPSSPSPESRPPGLPSVLPAAGAGSLCGKVDCIPEAVIWVLAVLAGVSALPILVGWTRPRSSWTSGGGSARIFPFRSGSSAFRKGASALILPFRIGRWRWR
jgi:hypothetical protein